MTLLIENADVYADPGDRWVFCENGSITAHGPGSPPTVPDGTQRIDAGGRALLPGFIDIHVHGGASADTMDATPSALQQMAAFYARHGVTSFLATTWTDTQANITAALENAAACMGPQPNGATLRGVHLEGPYLNPSQSGAQAANLIRQATPAEANAWLDIGVIRLLSLAPEYPENHWLIEAAAAIGITVSAAHTNGSYEDIWQAARIGLSHSTHTFNAMTGLHHRRPGVLGAVITHPGIRCELIADNVHVHPSAMCLLWHAKQHRNVVLITDAIRAAGMRDGDYPVDKRIITVRDGVARLPDGTLAGSTLTMDRALANFAAATGEDLRAIYPTATRFPAEAAGLFDIVGSIAPGKLADLVLLDDDYTVRLTVVGGDTVYDNLDDEIV